MPTTLLSSGGPSRSVMNGEGWEIGPEKKCTELQRVSRVGKEDDLSLMCGSRGRDG